MDDEPKSAEQLALKLATDPDDISNVGEYIDRHFDYRERVREAATLYQNRKARLAHPEGKWNNGLWFPTGSEVQPCCQHIAEPTKDYPYSLMLHCRTLPHICNLKRVLAKDVRQHFKLHEATDPDDIDPQEYLTAGIKTYTLMGSSLFNAYGIVQLAMREWSMRTPKKKAWATNVLREGWPGIPEPVILSVLKGVTRIERDGNNAVIYYQEHADLPTNRKGRRRPPQ